LLLEETDTTLEELSLQTGLPMERVEAIAHGRWTPSPAEREKLAAAFGVDVTDVSWGHTMNPRNVRYHRFGLKEDF
jgi:transcriptional regulator with XRE-family HTH domain